MGGQGYDGGAQGWITEWDTGASAVATPQVTSRPKDEVQPKSWTASDVSASGQLEVQTDGLEEASAILRSPLAKVRAAIAKIQGNPDAMNCLAAWPQGKQTGTNFLQAVDAFTQTSQATHDAHATAAGHMKASAAAYSDAETTNTAKAKNASGWLGA